MRKSTFSEVRIAGYDAPSWGSGAAYVCRRENRRAAMPRQSAARRVIV